MKLEKIDMPKGGSGGGGKFLKIEVGQSAVGVFRTKNPDDKPHKFYQKWPRGGTKETSETPKPGFDPRFKVNFVVYNQEEKRFEAKIYEYNAEFNNQMVEIQEAYDITTIKCRISRVASGKGSLYVLMPLIKEQIPEKAMAEIKAVELHDLSGTTVPAQAKDDSDPLPF